jgi:hypothetical protein
MTSDLVNLPVTSREYKILLNSNRFTNSSNGVEQFIEFIQKQTVRLGGEFIDYRESLKRKTWYLDTNDAKLKKHGYILRIRDDEDSKKRFKITLKYRNPDRYIAASEALTIISPNKSKYKFEEDILPPFKSNYSCSSVVSKNQLPELGKIKKLLKLFPNLEKLEVDEDARIFSPNKFKAYETTYWIGAINFGDNIPVKCCLNFWHKAAGRKGLPLVAEFSFDYDSNQTQDNDSLEKYCESTVKSSAGLFKKIQKDLYWYNSTSSATKTHLAYNIL